jgi:hypothetical protein
MSVTRIKNNQIFDSSVVAFAKVQAGSITGNLLAPTVTFNSNITITGNLDVYGNTSTINSINTFINDPIVTFNHGYTGSIAGYDIGILVNRNFNTLGPYGAVNTAWVWREADQSFQAIATNATGNALVSLTNNGFANLRVGNIIANSITITSGSIIAPGGIQNTPIGNTTPNLANFTTLYTNNFSSPNAVVTGGSVNGTVIGNTTQALGSFTGLTATTGFQTANIRVTGGYINNLANVSADIAWLTRANISSANITALSGTTGNLITLVVTNFSSANANIMGTQTYIGGSVNTGEIIANVYSNLGFFNNFTAANAIILGATSYIGTGATPIANAYVGTMFVTTAGGFSTANARITGGFADNFQIGANVPATGTFSNLTTTPAATVTVQNQENSSQSVMTGALRVAGGASISKDLYVLGNVYTSNLISTSTTTLNVQVPLLSLTSNSVFPYNYDIGFYSEFVGGSANVYQTTGFIRNEADNFWYLFSGAPEPIGAVIPLTDPSTVLDTLRLGEIVVSNTTQATSTITGAVRIAGGVGIDRDLYSYRQNSTFGNVQWSFAQNFQSANALVNGGAINNTVIGNATAAVARVTNLYATSVSFLAGNVVANSTSTSTNTTTGAIVITGAGGLGVGGNAYVGGIQVVNGNIVAASGTATTGRTTGALVITGAGGLGVGGNITIGAVTNDARLVVAGQDSMVSAATAGGTILHTSGVDGQINRMVSDSFGTGVFSAFTGRSARGTAASPTASQANDLMTEYTARGYGATTFGTVSTGSIGFLAAENMTDTARGTYVSFYTTTIGQAVRTERVRITDQGNLVVYTGNILAANTEPTTSPTTGALVVLGGAGFNSNVIVNRGANINVSNTTGADFYVRGTTDNSLIWARADATYDTVVVGGSATTANLNIGVKFQVNSTDAMQLPAGTNAGRPGNMGGQDVEGLFRYNTSLHAIEWYSGAAFGGWQTAGTTFTIVSDYQFNGDNVTDTFVMAGADTTTAAAIVSINGVIQIPTLAYSVTTGNTVVFTEPPVTGDVVDVRTLVTTQTITALTSTNGYMTITTENAGVLITTGTEQPTLTTYWEPTAAQVSSIPNVTIATANVSTPIDSFDVTLYRTAKYVIQATRGSAYQSSEVLVVHNTTTATATTYAVVNTGANLGVVAANVSLGNVKLNFIPALSNTDVRIKKDYLLI